MNRNIYILAFCAIHSMVLILLYIPRVFAVFDSTLIKLTTIPIPGYLPCLILEVRYLTYRRNDVKIRKFLIIYRFIIRMITRRTSSTSVGVGGNCSTLTNRVTTVVIILFSRDYPPPGSSTTW